MRSNARAELATNTKMSRLAKFDVVSIEDLDTSDIERVFALADEFADKLERGEQITTAAGLIMATLFYEPSTRTRLSFESSMQVREAVRHGEPGGQFVEIQRLA